MRLELDIDDELFQHLEAEARLSGLTVEDAFDRCVRRGLQRFKTRGAKPGYQCPVFTMGWPEGMDINKAIGLAAELEDMERSSDSSFIPHRSSFRTG